MFIKRRGQLYVDYKAGLDTNDGLTRTTPVKTLPVAYTKLSSAGTVNTNIIVIMKDYTGIAFNTSSLLSAKMEKLQQLQEHMTDKKKVERCYYQVEQQEDL